MQGDLTDDLQFGFTVNATVYTANPTESNLTGVTGANAPTAIGSSRTCREICGRFQSFVCDVKYRCWDDFLQFILIIVMIVGTCKVPLPPNHPRQTLSHLIVNTS